MTFENQVNPIGTDIVHPNLSWVIESKIRSEKQTAYQILVASSPEILAKDKGDLWNSDKQLSEQSVLLKYAGKPLITGMRCFWKVRVWDKDNKISAWSEPAQWSMGLLNPDDWKGKWIGIDKIFPGEDDKGEYRKLAARYLRKEFKVTKIIKNATAYISGLGLYELHINGKRIGNMVLAPGATQYTKTVFYNAFDVTSQLTFGKNAIGVILGNGRYFAMRKSIQNFGFPRLLMQLNIEYKDGSKELICSDESWKLLVNGPITENNEFDGEKYDARLEMPGWDKKGFDESKWLTAQVVSRPGGKLVAQLNEPIRVTGYIHPVSLKQLKPGVFIFDMGQNMVGWTSLSVKGNKGDKISLRFSEILKTDGSLYLDNLRSAQVTDSYILKGEGVETWEPKFTYHGFRFVELTGMKSIPKLSTITGCIVNDDLSNNGSFECSDPIITQIYKNATWGIRGNYRSFPTDCPQRDERMGWLGDRAGGCRGESYIFNNGGLYRKWLGDMRDEQTVEGSIPDVCPAYWTVYNDNVTWDGTGIMITEMLLDQFGASNAVAENYDSMKKWLMYMYQKYAVNGLMPRDTYGDWCMPPEDLTIIHSKDPNKITESTLLGTSFFYHDVRIMQKFAMLLSKDDDQKLFEKIAVEIKTSYNKQFFHPFLNYYSNNTPTANVLSLAFDLVPDNKRQMVFNNIVQKIEMDYNGHIPVGLIGMMNLQRVLTEFERSDIALRFASETTYPSWGYMIKNGATTIWELWNGNTADPAMNSGNHVMLLGDLIIWMHENIGGIKPSDPGFKSIVMKPLITKDITFAKTSHISPYGNIVSNWKFNKNNDFVWDVEIPVNTKAKVYLPAVDINSVLESNQKISSSNGVTFLELKDGFAVYEVLSGVYHFVSKEVKITKYNFPVSTKVNILPNDTSLNLTKP
ncbi:MAG: glycoside hydrolase family 78 protein [Paludibacter sp.]